MSRPLPCFKVALGGRESLLPRNEADGRLAANNWFFAISSGKEIISTRSNPANRPDS
jgi:hypothetical protein